MRNGAVVDAAGEDAAVVVAQVGNILLRFPHRVVEAIVAEEVEILHAAQFADLREEVVARLNGIGHNVGSNVALRAARVFGIVAVDGRNLLRVPQVSVVEVAAHNPVVRLISEVERTNRHAAFRHAVSLVFRSVARGTAVVAAHGHAQSRHGVVVHAEGAGILRAAPELEGVFMAVLDPVGIVELICLKPLHTEHFIAPMLRTAPETDARLVPGGGHDAGLLFGAVDGEELVRLVVVVQPAHGNDNMAGADIGGGAECLFYPELFEFHLAALLEFGFNLSALVVLNFHGRASAAVLIFQFGVHAPALAEVVANHEGDVGQVELAAALAVLELLRLDVARVLVAVKIAARHRLAVAAQHEAFLFLGLRQQFCSLFFFFLCLLNNHAVSPLLRRHGCKREAAKKEERAIKCFNLHVSSLNFSGAKFAVSPCGGNRQ